MLGNTLRKARKNKNMTQQDVAHFLCVKRQTYSAYERNISVPDGNTIKKLAEFFDVSADVLLGVKRRSNNALALLYNIENDLSSENIKALREYAELLIIKQKSEDGACSLAAEKRGNWHTD